MRVPDQILKTAIFLGVLTGDGEQYLGTGFIITVAYGRGHVFEIKYPEGGVTTIRMPFAFLVTAKHVAETLEGADFYIRANKADGSGVAVIEGSHETRWWYHPTEKESVDAALMLFPPKTLMKLDYAPIAITMFANEKIIEDKNLGVGDEVFISGLFTKVIGEAKNIPIIRTGTVAMMPDEKILFRGKMVHAYLVESRSIGGLSGSPVFIRETISTPITVDRFKSRWPPDVHERETGQGITTELRGLGRFYFLGSMMGHWDVPKSAIPSAVEAVNMGISPMVPAQKIYEIITQPELMELMHKINADMTAKEHEGDVLDAAITTGSKEKLPTQTTAQGAEIPVPTEQQFLDDLTKATRKVER